MVSAPSRRELVSGHRPAYDTPAEHIKHDGQIQKSLAAWNVGGVCRPQHVRRCGTEVVTHQIRSAPGSRACARRAFPLPATDPAQARQTHEPRDPLAPDMLAFTFKLGMDTRRAISAARTGVQRANTREQLRVAARPSGRFSHEPRVVAAGGDSQQPCHRGNGPAGPVRPHESVPFDGTASVSRANQAAARESMSRSTSSWRTLRRSRVNSCRSAAVSPS